MVLLFRVLSLRESSSRLAPSSFLFCFSGVRTKMTSELVLLDVTPLSLGIETVGHVMSVVIPRNTRIPCIRSQIYTVSILHLFFDSCTVQTEENYQTAVDISVFEGERARTDENNLLGEFQITGIERAKRGEPKIEVTFSIDSNGILNVSAIDLKTRVKANTTINSRHRSTDAEVEDMIRAAELNRLEDEKFQQHHEACHKLELLVSELAEMEVEDERRASELTTLVSESQRWIDEDAPSASLAQIESQFEKLQRASTKLLR